MDTSENPGTATSPKRVVILGGGAAGVAAAYWLSVPHQNGLYEVTLYSQGWRLGGKCASGRNAAQYNSIEEHGLHMLMGCYQNAFATMRACYLDWRSLKTDPDNMLQVWTDAFLPQRLVSMMEQDGPGSPPSWSPWNFPFPKLPGEPGDGPLVPGSANHSLTPDEQLLIVMAEWLMEYTPKTAPYYSLLATAMKAVKALFFAAGTVIGPTQSALEKAAEAVRPLVQAKPPGAPLAESESPDESQFLHRLAILADLGIAIALGFVSDLYRKGEAGYDTLNKQDLRAWLAANGASQTALGSAPIQAFYDLTFAAIDGIAGGAASIAAGVSFRTMVEMAFGYRDAPLWKMAAGMGDVVFAPLYEVLTARGVKVEFFSRVTALRPGAGGTLGEIDISTQATTVSGAPYQPFTRITCANGKQLDAWPNQPDWSQLTNGAALQAEGADFEYSGCTISVGPPTTLQAGVDFDIAISAMPPAVLIPMANALTTASPDWNTALGHSRSVPTQSLQLWLKPDLCDLGWTYGTTVLTSYVEPYDSWGDMSQVIGAESWPSASGPGSIGYFCGTLQVMNWPVTLQEMEQVVTGAANTWMTASLSTLWPNIGSNPLQSPDILQRFDQANFDFSDQYVQTPAGNNVSSRFDPSLPAGFSNFYVIGDWTKTRFSGGCFESAIESAMLVSRGISGWPQSIKTA